MTRRQALSLFVPAPVLLAASRIPATRELEDQLLAAVNEVREQHGFARLAWDEAAHQAALFHSLRMAQDNFFAHVDPQYGNLPRRLRNAGLRWKACAENLYTQNGFPDPVESAVSAWLRSGGHRVNLLSAAYTHTGIGVASAGRNTYYYTQIFLTPA
ncbi:MAG: CAP domain-containing protein [Bryobacteraceae bacterium]